MRHLLRTTAIAAVFGCVTMTAQAQQSDGQTAEEQTGVSRDSGYCDRPWAQVDTNNDGFVSEAEASAESDYNFTELDTDGDGQITRPEWVECLTGTENQSAETDRSEQNFADADTDQDQQITRDEFRQGSQQAYEDAQAAGADDEALIVMRRYVFLTPEESQDPSTMQSMSADEAAGRSALTFSALDQNGDDIIDTQEWSERSPRITRNEDWANAEFDRIDDDATNSISQEEYRTARQEMLNDRMTTGSVSGDDAASGESTDSSGDAASSTSGSAQDIPVYIYRFSTM